MLVHTNTHAPVGTVGWDLIRSRFKEAARREEMGLEVFPACDTTPSNIIAIIQPMPVDIW